LKGKRGGEGSATHGSLTLQEQAKKPKIESGRGEGRKKREKKNVGESVCHRGERAGIIQDCLDRSVKGLNKTHLYRFLETVVRGRKEGKRREVIRRWKLREGGYAFEEKWSIRRVIQNYSVAREQNFMKNAGIVIWLF